MVPVAFTDASAVESGSITEGAIFLRLLCRIQWSRDALSNFGSLADAMTLSPKGPY